MHHSRVVILAILAVLAGAAPKALALGRAVTVFEASAQGGLWDHGNEMYLRFSLKRHPDIWAGLKRQPDGSFAGEVVFDQFTPQEQHASASAIVLMDGPKRKVIELSFSLSRGTEPVRVLLDRSE